MQTTTFDLGNQVAVVKDVVAGVGHDRLDGPTPCEDMSVAALLDHLVGLTLAFRRAAEKRPLSGAPTASAAALAPDWRTLLPAQLDALAAAWRDPAAWEGTAAAGGVEMPAPEMAAVALDEVVVHGWDLAVATGRPYRPDPASVEICWAFVEQFASAPPEVRAGLYGPVVPVADDAPRFDRLLGLTGRDPGWRP
jgi:uncharacterized protein (TIGR03086 family)